MSLRHRPAPARRHGRWTSHCIVLLAACGLLLPCRVEGKRDGGQLAGKVQVASTGRVESKRDKKQLVGKVALKMQAAHAKVRSGAMRAQAGGEELAAHQGAAGVHEHRERHIPPLTEVAIAGGQPVPVAAADPVVPSQRSPRPLFRDVPAASTWAELLSDIVGGTGASVSPTASSKIDQALLRRMRYQDKAVMLMLLAVYAGALAFSANLAYRHANNNSSVTYYADPRFYNLMFEAHDFERFLETFNQPPKDCHLQVTGLMPSSPFAEQFADAAVEWLGGQHRVAFSFALDLSPWMVRDGPDEADPPSSAGVHQDDLETLRRWLSEDQNDLACVNMVKEISWPCWEDLAINIKTRIRQSGFRGVIAVHHSAKESVVVYKNRRWANFMYGQTMKVLCALSLFGWCLYQPYMWMRRHSIDVRCKYRVNVGIDEYWSLIHDKLGVNGFDSNPESGIDAALPPGPTRQQASPPQPGPRQQGQQ